MRQAIPFFKALSDTTRLKLVLLLKHHGSMCVCDLTAILNQPQPTISRHLTHLKKAGVVISERRGTWMWYQLNKQLPPWCQQIINGIELTDEDQDFSALLRVDAPPPSCCPPNN